MPHPATRLRLFSGSVVFAAFCLTFLSIPAARAEVPPTTEYTAHFCTSTSSTVDYSWGGRVYNTSSTADITFNCPILNTWSGRIGWLELKVVDNSWDRDISCTLKVFLSNEYVATGWWDTRTSSGSGQTVQTLTFGTVGGTGTYHHFTMNCTVPRSYSGVTSSLNAYRVFEN